MDEQPGVDEGAADQWRTVGEQRLRFQYDQRGQRPGLGFGESHQQFAGVAQSCRRKGCFHQFLDGALRSGSRTCAGHRPELHANGDGERSHPADADYAGLDGSSRQPGGRDQAGEQPRSRGDEPGYRRGLCREWHRRRQHLQRTQRH